MLSRAKDPQPRETEPMAIRANEPKGWWWVTELGGRVRVPSK